CKPAWLSRCAELLDGSPVLASTVIGFPHGGHSTSAKLAEARQALADGGAELDMVVNVGRVRDGAWDVVTEEIRSVLDVTRGAGGVLKVIFETCYLETEQIRRLCAVCSELEVDFVKTSTGFGTAGATLEHVELMRHECPERIGVKASGGIRDLDTLLSLVEAGATRIGASGSEALVAAARERFDSASSD
ncbi:MAG: deoxyribose-phosphate aldolase, partial [Planctomycetota bacterium]|nr:deoxyribose-phosphate aldolase [Planctomycetota bacterium]